LISESGTYHEAVVGACGARIRKAREARGLSLAVAAAKAGLSAADYTRVESGSSPLERVGPVLLLCAELLDVPVFNLIDLLSEDIAPAGTQPD
jgi:transcriptional regulator with XRE-family HTH domain